MKFIYALIISGLSLHGQITARGDLSGFLPGPTVVKIQGRAVDSAAPSNQNVLLWNNAISKWVPGTLGWTYITGRPTALSSFTNDTNYITAASLTWANLTGKPTFASTNTASAVVQRDAIGNFAAGAITANLTGNVTGNVSGSAGTIGGLSLPSGTLNNEANKVVRTNVNGYTELGYVYYPQGVESAGALDRIYSSYDSYLRPMSIAWASKKILESPAHQINFVYGGSASTVIDATTVNNFWRSHAYAATVTEIACWTDAGTVSLTIKDSAGNAIASALSCGTGGAANSTINGYGVITAGEGLGFTTASVSSVKNLSVSIKYTRSYP